MHRDGDGAGPDPAGDPEAGFAAAMAQIDEWSAASQRQLALAQTMQRSIEQLSVTVWSSRREVCVTVDHAGQLSDVVFEDRALVTSPLELGRVVTTTIHRALAELEAKVVQVARATAGEGSALALSVEHEYRAAFAGPLSAAGDAEPSPR